MLDGIIYTILNWVDRTSQRIRKYMIEKSLPNPCKSASGFQDLFRVLRVTLFSRLTPSVNALPIRIPIPWRIGILQNAIRFYPFIRVGGTSHNSNRFRVVLLKNQWRAD